MSAKRKRVVLTMNMKLHALERMDRGESIKQIANELGVGASTVSDWRKNRDKLQSFFIYELDSSRRTLKKATNNTLDDALWFWFVEERKKGTLISGPLLRQVALDLNSAMGGSGNFTASTGWLTRWKKRHGVDTLPVGGERFTGGSTTDSSDKLIEENHLYPELICKVDETGLNCKTSLIGSTPASQENAENSVDSEIRTLNYESMDEKVWSKSQGSHCASVQSSENEHTSELVQIKQENIFSNSETDESRLELLFEGSEDRNTASTSAGSRTDTEDSARSCEYIEVNQEEISHVTGSEALELALKYVKQQAKTTEMDIFFLKKWRDFARKQVSNCKRQKKITDFFT